MLKQMDVEPDQSALSAWWETINGWREKHGLWTGDRFTRRDKIMPQDVIRTLYEVTNGEAFVCSDVGQHQMFAAQYYKYDQPRRWINSGGLGTMGFGLPAAMGVQLAHPESSVVVVTGEGSIQMCIEELSTCTQYNMPVKIINLNNAALGMVKQWQDIRWSLRGFNLCGFAARFRQARRSLRTRGNNCDRSIRAESKNGRVFRNEGSRSVYGYLHRSG